ncbi:MAG: malto-oligosyltrehalose synthase, partial [Acidobacteria bacterium]|nr:malto-oligosyltrehalose synthase [Acidobacteriota bacterium]
GSALPLPHLAARRARGGADHLGRFGTSLEEFHQRNADRLKSHPASLLATSTHDSKRSEDVRARINCLSEIPAEWEQAVLRWREMNRANKTSVDGIESPDANEEYLCYQTFVGSWPLEEFTPESREAYRLRIEEYMVKAAREAKLHTSWLNPDEVHENALRKFVRASVDPNPGNRFLPDFLAFLSPLLRAGMFNSLGQVLLKIASPGVPDFYQGSELWDLSLVDPDNRRPVDFDRRRRFLETLRPEGEALVRDLVQHPEDGRIKMYVIRNGLRYRCERRLLFQEGDYHAIAAQGPRKHSLVAFARRRGDQAAIAATGRFFLRARGWGEGPGKEDSLLLPEALENSRWRNVFTHQEVQATGRELPLDSTMRLLSVVLLDRVS